MRIVFIGAGELATETAKLLIERDHEIVIIEENEERIKRLSDSLDCSFLHGDGSKPQILEEAGPEHADFLFCLTEMTSTTSLPHWWDARSDTVK